MEKTNLKNIEIYITIRQLRFLSRIAKMETTRLTRQVINSQAIPQGKCAKGIQTTKRAYKDALIRAGLIDKKKGNVTTAEWITIMNNDETPEIIEKTLELKPGSLKKKKKGRERSKINIA